MKHKIIIYIFLGRLQLAKAQFHFPQKANLLLGDMGQELDNLLVITWLDIRFTGQLELQLHFLWV